MLLYGSVNFRNELEITRQKLELANKELQAKEALVT